MRKYDYDLIVIGAGAAGLVSAYYTRGLGKKVLIVSDYKLASKFRHDIPLKLFTDHTKTQKFAAQAYDHSASIEKRNTLIKSLSAHTLADQIRSSGIEVAGGYGKFSDPHTIKTGKKHFSAEIIIVATGSVPHIPDIEGIKGNTIDPDKFLSLEKLPDKIAIIGGGSAGTQFARALSFAGKKVVLIEEKEHILPREDREITSKVTDKYIKENIHIICAASISSIVNENGKKILTCHSSGKKHTISVDAVLLCAGRKAALDKLDLAAAGLDNARTDRSLRTQVPHIYMAGDAAGPWFMTAIAEERGACAAANAFGLIKTYPRYSHTLWNTFSAPNIARCGLTEEEAVARYGKRALRVYRFPFVYSLGAQIEDRSEGFAKFICRRNGQILGAHILDKDAESLILPVHTAHSLGIPL